MLPDPIEAVTLDAGGVLALPPVDVALRAVGLDVDVDAVLVAHHAAVAVEDALHAAAPAVADQLGDARAAYYTAFTEQLGIDPPLVAGLVESLDALARQEVPWHLVAPGARDLVPALNRLGVPVAVVSNSNGTVAHHLAAMGICQVGEGPAGRVVAVVDSAVVGVRKPDPGIFDHALAALGSVPGATVHVGDTVAFDVDAATAAGLAAIHYDATARCRGDHAHVASLAELVEVVAARRA